jgi:hypothetical protein
MTYVAFMFYFCSKGKPARSVVVHQFEILIRESQKSKNRLAQ